MRESVPAIMWGKNYIAECPFCQELVDQHQGGKCQHFRKADGKVFTFEE